VEIELKCGGFALLELEGRWRCVGDCGERLKLSCKMLLPHDSAATGCLAAWGHSARSNNLRQKPIPWNLGQA
jgi:hypothetical protein